MKKLLTMLVLAGFAYTNATAQSSYVCKKTSSKSQSCYKTSFNHNFKVCKDAYGYHICGRERTYATATQPKLPIVASARTTPSYSMQNATTALPQNLVAPQSQSYPATYNGEGAMSTGAYHGYYTGKGKIKVCYYGDNAAELSRAAYKGCTTPAWEGPEKNNVRNLNVSNSNSHDLAPIDGNNSNR